MEVPFRQRLVKLFREGAFDFKRPWNSQETKCALVVLTQSIFQDGLKELATVRTNFEALVALYGSYNNIEEKVQEVNNRYADIANKIDCGIKIVKSEAPVNDWVEQYVNSDLYKNYLKENAE